MNKKTFGALLTISSLVIMGTYIYGWETDKYQTGYAAGIWVFAVIVFISGLVIYFHEDNP